MNVDEDDSSANGYTYMLSTMRPLPAGEYRVHYISQHYTRIPCNFKPDDTYSDWTVTVTAPAGTAHEAFFDPVAIGSGVGADASNGVLDPKAFSVGQVSTDLQSLKWQGGSATLTLSAPASLSGHFLDFIALDGTVAVSLDGGEASVSGGTLTWSVPAQPWQADDKLMLRIRQSGAPIFDEGSYAFSIGEHAELAATVGTVSATERAARGQHRLQHHGGQRRGEVCHRERHRGHRGGSRVGLRDDRLLQPDGPSERRDQQRHGVRPRHRNGRQRCAGPDSPGYPGAHAGTHPDPTSNLNAGASGRLARSRPGDGDV